MYIDALVICLFYAVIVQAYQLALLSCFKAAWRYCSLNID